MTIRKIPKITYKHITEQNKDMRQRVTSGNLTTWLDEQLRWLANNNPILYKYVTEHAQKFAMGVMMAGDPSAIAMSHALEQIQLLTLLGCGLQDVESMDKFSDMMKTWLKDNELEGLDKFGENDKDKGDSGGETKPV